MKKLRKAKEIFEQELSGEPLEQDVVIEAIKLAQKNIIEVTLNLIGNKIIEIQKPDSRKYVSKKAILDYKRNLFKMIE